MGCALVLAAATCCSFVSRRASGAAHDRCPTHDSSKIEPRVESVRVRVLELTKAVTVARCLTGGCVQVITQGKEPTLVAQGGSVTKHEVPPVAASDIVDTNGAGDAFVGGFLAAFIKGKGTADCCKAGNHAASVIIKTAGTALPDSCDYSL